MYACVSHTVIGRAGSEHCVAHDTALHQLVGVARLRDADAVDGELTSRLFVGRRLRRHHTVRVQVLVCGMYMYVLQVLVKPHETNLN